MTLHLGLPDRPGDRRPTCTAVDRRLRDLALAARAVPRRRRPSLDRLVAEKRRLIGRAARLEGRAARPVPGDPRRNEALAALGSRRAGPGSRPTAIGWSRRSGTTSVARSREYSIVLLRRGADPRGDAVGSRRSRGLTRRVGKKIGDSRLQPAGDRPSDRSKMVGDEPGRACATASRGQIGHVSRAIGSVSEVHRPMKAPEPALRLPYRRGSVEFCRRHRGRPRGGLPDPPARLPRPRPRLVPRRPGRPRLPARPAAARQGRQPGRQPRPLHRARRSATASTHAADERRDVGRHPARVPRPRLRPEPDAARRRPGPRGRGRRPGADDRDAAVLPAARLGRLRPADLRPDPQPQPPPGERRRDRGQGRLLARPPLAAGRAERPDGTSTTPSSAGTPAASSAPRTTGVG